MTDKIFTKIILNLCVALTVGATPVAASEEPGAPATELAPTNSERGSADFNSITDKLRNVDKVFRAEIARVEKSQPDWDSTQIKTVLDQAQTELESTHQGNYQKFISLGILACQTPFLDWELLKSANTMFKIPQDWYLNHYFGWFRSAFDLTELVPSLPQSYHNFQQRLNSAQPAHRISKNRYFQSLVRRCAAELSAGDTHKANQSSWQILMQLQKSGDYKITADFLSWYDFFLHGMIHRPNNSIYQQHIAYVNREKHCVEYDGEFIDNLDKLSSTLDSKVVQQLKRTHSNLVRQRRVEDTESLIATNQKLIELANTSGDRSCALPYYSLVVYHAYLGAYTKNNDYDKLCAQIYPAWAAEELGKQTSLADENMKSGKDWQRLECALTALHQQSFVICRDIKYCHQWGESTPASILELEQKSGMKKGIVYFQSPGNSTNLYLVFKSLSEGKSSDSKNNADQATTAEAATDQIVKQLTAVGFDPNHSKGSSYIRVTGNWDRSQARQ